MPRNRELDGSGTLSSCMSEIDNRLILTEDKLKPGECIKCFAPDPQTAREYGGFRCFCPACEHEWFEKIKHLQF